MSRGKYKADRNRIIICILALVFIISFFVSFKALASEDAGVVDIEEDNSISGVVLPIVRDNGDSPFNFIIDPFTLVYDTDASRYGGGVVEEGATLLFRNLDGVYDFSSHSDKLAASNEGAAPVRVTVSAYMEGLGSLVLADSCDFDGNEDIFMYVALFDGNGEEVALMPDGEVSISDILFPGESYSFGLTGASNPDADWLNVSVHPSVKVTWQVELVAEGLERDSDEDSDTTRTISGIDYAEPEDSDGDMVNLSSNEVDEKNIDNYAIDDNQDDADIITEDAPSVSDNHIDYWETVEE